MLAGFCTVGGPWRRRKANIKKDHRSKHFGRRAKIHVYSPRHRVFPRTPDTSCQPSSSLLPPSDLPYGPHGQECVYLSVHSVNQSSRREPAGYKACIRGPALTFGLPRRFPGRDHYINSRSVQSRLSFIPYRGAQCTS